MSKLFSLCILLVLIFTSCKANAQKVIHSGDQQWVQYYNETQVSEKFFINSDIGLRTRDKFSNLNTLLIRSGLGYKIYENISGNSGVALFTTLASNKISRLEIRPFQDFVMTNEYPKVTIRNRFRIEARYFKNIENDQITNNDDFNFRFRYALNFQIPILRLSRENLERKILFNLGDEIFINAGKEIIYNVLDNNRLITGLSYQENRNFRINLLYNYQFGQGMQPATYRQTHIVWVTITHKIIHTPKS